MFHKERLGYTLHIHKIIPCVISYVCVGTLPMCCIMLDCLYCLKTSDGSGTWQMGFFNSIQFQSPAGVPHFNSPLNVLPWTRLLLQCPRRSMARRPRLWKGRPSIGYPRQTLSTSTDVSLLNISIPFHSISNYLIFLFGMAYVCPEAARDHRFLLHEGNISVT